MSTAKNTFTYTEKTSQKSENMQKRKIILFVTVVFMGLLSLVLLIGCGDYYVNVDKDAVKIEADVEGLINGND
jgi:cell division protein FtsB